MNMMRLKKYSSIQLMSMASTLWQLNLLELAIKNGGYDIDDLAKKINLKLWNAAVRSKVFPKEMMEFPLVESYMDNYGMEMDRSFPNALELVHLFVVRPMFCKPVLFDLRTKTKYELTNAENSGMGALFMRSGITGHNERIMNFTGWSIKDAVLCNDGPEDVLMRTPVPGPVPIGNTYSLPGKKPRHSLVDDEAFA